MNKVELLPWDPTSESQYQRLYDQRVACGWHEDEISEWKDQQLKETKTLYWIVLADNLPNRAEFIAQHIATYPNEQEPLVDTAAKIWNEPRDPSNRRFHPVGHTAIELVPTEEKKELRLPQSTVWIKHLYISWALHRGGIGRDAMRQTERIAALPPLNATTAALDTIRKEVQLTESHLEQSYEAKGRTRPEEVRTNEEWYLRQGYEELDGSTPLVWTNPETGEVVIVPRIFFRKYLT